MLDCERNGEKFSLKTFLNARDKCIHIVYEIISHIQPGMSESEGQQLIKDVFASYGITKFWHPTKFRISSDTTKTFRAPPDETLKCEESDLCFIDVGPIIDDHEADFGRTFLVPGLTTKTTIDPEKVRLLEASRLVFDDVSSAWKIQGLTGEALYKFADQCAKKIGYELNPLMSGHRLGDFPHKLNSAQKLSELSATPSANLWILEIHLVDSKLNRGSFFEDLLF